MLNEFKEIIWTLYASNDEFPLQIYIHVGALRRTFIVWLYLFRWLINAGKRIGNDREKYRNVCVAARKPFENSYRVLMILTKGFSLLFGLTHALTCFLLYYKFLTNRWMNTCAIECYDLPMVLLTVTRYTTFEGLIVVIESHRFGIITYL